MKKVVLELQVPDNVRDFVQERLEEFVAGLMVRASLMTERRELKIVDSDETRLIVETEYI